MSSGPVPIIASWTYTLTPLGGTFAPPGGHLEHGESLEECAARETLEETGLVVSGMRFLTATNDIFSDKEKHYITMYVACELEDPCAEPKVRQKTRSLQGSYKHDYFTNYRTADREV
jgi:ADP-ribose pyrophosphatase YjhB (NUDIX family)